MPGPGTVFTRKRFKQITALLHYCDESQAKPREHPDYDRLYKVKFLTEHLKETFQKYYVLHRETSVDECMIPFRGRWGKKQYAKDKPVKWGVKAWLLCDSVTGYNFNFDIYCGKDSDFDHLENIGLASGVVLKLCQELYGKGYYIFTDRFYTSPMLLHYLRQVDCSGCGTVMTNRKHFPKQLVKKNRNVKSPAPLSGCNAATQALLQQGGQTKHLFTF